MLKKIRDKAFGLIGINNRFDVLQNKIDSILQQLEINKLNIKQDGSTSVNNITAETDQEIISRSGLILLRAIALGRNGRFKIAPEFISISATSNCNLKCIMCLGHAGNTSPNLTVEEAEMLFCSLADKDINFGKPKFLDMTAGEPTLNPSLGLIYRKFKEFFPDSKISMITNATIPIKDGTRDAYELADRIGMSMDGATPETYERIRRGAIYKNVIRNVRDVAELKKPGVNCDSLHLLFVAMDQNINELPEMVRLAHSLGVPALFAQESEVRGEAPFNGGEQNITLSLSNIELAPFVIEAKVEAERLGVNLELTSRLEEALNLTIPIQAKPVKEQNKQFSVILEDAISNCSYPWLCAPSILKNNTDGIHPRVVCCHMPRPHKGGELYNRADMKYKTILEMFNSEFYWDIRSGLLDGTLARDACKGCQYYRLTQWTANQLRELEASMDEVECEH